MAQTQKKEMKDAIIEAAKKEFLEKGYKDASLRTIANKAHMTVGNLYRYFKNKEDINEQIVGETLNQIDEVVKNMTKNDLSLQTHVFSVKYDVGQLKEMFDKMSVELVDIYESHHDEFNILMMDSSINEELIEWFGKLISTIISCSFQIEKYEQEVNLLSRSYAISIFSGLRELFKNNDVEPKKLKVLVSIYFRSYVYMLDGDLRSLIG